MTGFLDRPSQWHRRAVALLVLLVQLAGAALAHAERVPVNQDRVAAAGDITAAAHSLTCAACVLGHAPAVPSAPTSPALAYVAHAHQTAAELVVAHSHTTIPQHSRAPPVLQV
jgi:hypothetical protein